MFSPVVISVLVVVVMVEEVVEVVATTWWWNWYTRTFIVCSESKSTTLQQIRVFLSFDPVLLGSAYHEGIIVVNVVERVLVINVVEVGWVVILAAVVVVVGVIVEGIFTVLRLGTTAQKQCRDYESEHGGDLSATATIGCGLVRI